MSKRIELSEEFLKYLLAELYHDFSENRYCASWLILKTDAEGNFDMTQFEEWLIEKFPEERFVWEEDYPPLMAAFTRAMQKRKENKDEYRW